jgi:hypothetical protein
MLRAEAGIYWFSADKAGHNTDNLRTESEMIFLTGSFPLFVREVSGSVRLCPR